MYISHAQLAERPGARELAQVATAAHEHLVSYELMEATLLGGDRSAWSPEEIAIADDAVQRIDDAVNDAGSLIDGYLVKRGYSVPLDPVPDLVVTWARWITRYLLHQDRITDERGDPIVRDYRDALKFLQQVANGQFSLGANDPVTESSADLDVQFESDRPVFGRGRGY